MNSTNILQKIIYKKMNNIFIKMDYLNYAIIKGEPLSYYAYGALGKRPYTDIDILIQRINIKTLEEILKTECYKGQYDLLSQKERQINRIFCITNSHQLLPYKDITDNINIDINFDIFWGEYKGKRIDIDEFLSDTVEMDIYGVKVKTLPPIKALIQLVLHHYRDMNSIFLLATRKSIRYEMFRDVYYLLKNNLDTITIEKLYKMSAEYEIIPYVFYVLYYTGQVFEDEEPKRYIEAFRTPEGEALLNCYGLCAKERKEWRYGFDVRLAADNLYELIKDDLTEKDMEKISVNKRVFMGIDE